MFQSGGTSNARRPLVLRRSTFFLLLSFLLVLLPVLLHASLPSSSLFPAFLSPSLRNPATIYENFANFAEEWTEELTVTSKDHSVESIEFSISPTASGSNESDNSRQNDEENATDYPIAPSLEPRIDPISATNIPSNSPYRTSSDPIHPLPPGFVPEYLVAVPPEMSNRAVGHPKYLLKASLDRTSHPSVGIFGGGMGGSFIYLALSESQLALGTVLLFEKAGTIIPTSSTSYIGFWKLHRGLHYSLDELTAILLAKKSRSMAERLSDSRLFMPDKEVLYLCRDEECVQTGKRLMAEDPSTTWEVTIPDYLDRSQLLLAYISIEPRTNITAIRQFIREEVEASGRNMEIKTNHRVDSIVGLVDGSGYAISVTNTTSSLGSCYLMNVAVDSTWERMRELEKWLAVHSPYTQTRIEDLLHEMVRIKTCVNVILPLSIARMKKATGILQGAYASWVPREDLHERAI